MARSPVLSRRGFLRAGAGLALGLSLARLPGNAAAREPAPSGDISTDAWMRLARGLQGTLLLPGDAGFARRAQPHSLQFASVLPAGIAACASIDDVRTSLLWARTHGLPFVVRSGGHSYAGYSTTTGLMIDVSDMHGVSTDTTSGLAFVDAGAHNTDMYAALRPTGRAVTHGRCGSVGVAGLVLGGGIGFSMRRRGLLCDQLVETRMITADGELLRCSQDEHPGLFWACRGGGGGNFGVNVGFTFQTFPAVPVTTYQITWQDGLDQLLPRALELLPATPDRLGCKLSVVNDGTPLSLELLGQLEGNPTELRSLFDPLYRLAPPAEEIVNQQPYWDAQDFLFDPGTPGYSHERSRYVYDPLPEAASAAILDHLRRWPGTHAEATWKAFLAGGAVDTVAPDATSYVHRGASVISSAEVEWTPDDSVGVVDQNEAWLADFHSAMAAYTSDQSYQNFIDGAQTDFLHAYYGSNLPRLVAVKRHYDPDAAFSFPQAIPLSLGIAGLARHGERASAHPWTSPGRTDRLVPADYVNSSRWS